MPNFTEVFEDVTKLGKKIPTNLYLESGLYPVIDQGQSYIAGYINDSDGIFFDVPAIIFGDHTRAIKYVNQPFFLGADGVKVLKAKVDNVDYKYLYYSLCYAKIPNTGYNRHFKWLKEVEIPLPPLEIQREIAYNLDKASEAIDLCRKILEKLDFLVKAKFAEMFGDPITNPMRWETTSIGQVVTDVRYGTSRPAVENGKYSYLRMNNITYDGHLDLTDLKRIDIPDGEVEKCIVRNGDVLFNRTNSVDLVGKTCVFDREDEMIIAGYIIRVRLNDEMLPVFLSTYLNTKSLKKALREMSKGAVNQANINAKELQGISIYLPPLPLQEQFAEYVKKIDLAKSAVKKTLEKAQTLKNALMQKYFG